MSQRENLSYVLRSIRLPFQSFKIIDNNIDPIFVFDPVKNQIKTGQYFVKCPERLTKILPGSSLIPLSFLKMLGLITTIINSQEKLSTSMKGTDKNLALFFQDNNFLLRVFHGSTNNFALRLSQLAADTKGFGDIVIRAEYQSLIAKLMSPIIKKNSNYHLRIIEDCIASSDSIAGVLRLLKNIKPKMVDGVIRIDVAVASTQGIIVIKKIAQQNKLKLELNVGYLAYGLSSGKAHANYMIYPDEIKKKLQIDFNDVVGDMGDAFKSLPVDYDNECQWNRFRRGIKSQLNKPLDLKKPTILYFANGGYFMKALKHYLLSDNDDNEVVFSAKRIWSSDKKYGYGVLIYDLLIS